MFENMQQRLQASCKFDDFMHRLARFLWPGPSLLPQASASSQPVMQSEWLGHYSQAAGQTVGRHKQHSLKKADVQCCQYDETAPFTAGGKMAHQCDKPLRLAVDSCLCIRGPDGSQ